jgi:DNA repair protein RadC
VDSDPPMATEGMGPRERAVEDGLGALSDAELVALVLGTGRVGEPIAVLAAALLEESGGVGGLARAGLGELAARRGLGPAKAARLASAIELGRRVAATAARPTDARFPSSAAVDGWARPRLGSLDHEELWALVLDGHQGLRAARRVASGGLHGLHVGARDPLRFALRDGGSSFVLVHNHPSGDPAPSAEDVRFTEEVARAADVVGVPLLDHVIVARGGYASLLDRGVIGGSDPSIKRAKLRSA